MSCQVTPPPQRRDATTVLYLRSVLHRENGLAERAKRALQPHEIRQQEVLCMYVWLYVCMNVYMALSTSRTAQDEQVLSD